VPDDGSVSLSDLWEEPAFYKLAAPPGEDSKMSRWEERARSCEAAF